MILNTQGASIHETSETETRDIVFPHQEEEVAQIAVDIGGSLAKVIWFSKSSETPGGRLNFVKFETQKIGDCVAFIKKVLEETSPHIPLGKRVIKATGGGSHKFYDHFRETLGVTVQKEDEMECLISGLNFLVREIPDEAFTYDDRRTEPLAFESMPGEIFPYLLVNIGSGVSILKVTSDETYERISGTSLGGGTLWGLLSMLTSAKSYDEMLELSKEGDNKNVDMLVGDIYGGDYPKIGLKASTIASSFGKVFKLPQEERSKLKGEDISRSLLYLVSNNIGQIAYLNAQSHGIQRIYFSGFFIRGHPVTMNTLNYAIHFWSKGKMKALFLRHEGYLGALGAFLRHSFRRRLGSFTENFSQIQKISGSSPFSVGALETFVTTATAFPLLLDITTYHPDTLDLSEARIQQYWIDLLGKNLRDLVDMVIEWQGGSEQAKGRASSFESMYRDHLQRLRKEPTAYGVLSVRSLLNLREQCLREMGFVDIFEGVKKAENSAALSILSKLLEESDSIGEADIVEYLTDNILAGNMYDWGSTSVLELLRSGELDFRTAKDKVRHPQKFDHLEHLKTTFYTKKYKKAVIFVDNSGADVVLGILPFARYLLSKGTSVILAANTRPSVNDVTAYELEDIVQQAAEIDARIDSSWKAKKLKVIGTGSSSPCLGTILPGYILLISQDLRKVSDELSQESDGVDLVVFEGMGRAIHTNYYAKLSVDCLKIAVFKNPEVASQLGGL
ncbi:hypothetical protein HDU97_002549 [Phlyctochytrium planicorne]|nr:hypothetical protein HDU97_002549 [Phlyctochytrium planicorne]